jgi:hypothetical protein
MALPIVLDVPIVFVDPYLDDHHVLLKFTLPAILFNNHKFTGNED